MRLFKYFAAYADLVVTIEGWLGHLAGQLGRPLRLVLMAGSYEADWYVPTVTELSSSLTGRSGRAESPELLGASVRAPLPRRARRVLLAAVLGSLGPVTQKETAAILLPAVRSRDPELRAAAARGLGAQLPASPAVAALLGCLEDPEPPVRRAAARALLSRKVADARVPTRETLLAHEAISRQAWKEVFALGDAALPALAVALAGRYEPVRREARWAMGRLLAGRAAARRQELQPAP
jgi:hypothetical protein